MSVYEGRSYSLFCIIFLFLFLFLVHGLPFHKTLLKKKKGSESVNISGQDCSSEVSNYITACIPVSAFAYPLPTDHEECPGNRSSLGIKQNKNN